MKKYTLEKLEKQVKNTREKTLKKKKEMYRLCIGLGFTPAESCFLTGKKESVIRELAEERRLKQLNGGQ